MAVLCLCLCPSWDRGRARLSREGGRSNESRILGSGRRSVLSSAATMTTSVLGQWLQVGRSCAASVAGGGGSCRPYLMVSCRGRNGCRQPRCSAHGRRWTTERGRSVPRIPLRAPRLLYARRAAVPAEKTPLSAYRLARLLHAAGARSVRNQALGGLALVGDGAGVEGRERSR